MKIKKYLNEGVITKNLVHKPTLYESDMAKKGYIRFRDLRGRLYNYVPEGYSIINNSGKLVKEKNTDYNYGYTLPELIVERPAYTLHEKEVAEYAKNNPNTSTIEGIDLSKWEDLRGLFGNIRDALNVTDTRNDTNLSWYKRLADKVLWELDSHNPSGGLEGVALNPGMMVIGAVSAEPLQLLKFLGSGIAINNLTTPFTGKTIGLHIGDVTPIVTGTTGDIIATTIGGGIGNKLINKGYNIYNNYKLNTNYLDNNSELLLNSETNYGNKGITDLGELIGATRESLLKTRNYYHSSEFKNRLKNAGFSDDEVYATISELEKIMDMALKKGVIIEHDNTPLIRHGYSRSYAKTNSDGLLMTNENGENIYIGSKSVIHPEKLNTIEHFISTVLHEYGGHSSTAAINNSEYASQFPMITKMINFNNNLPLKYGNRQQKILELLKNPVNQILQNLSKNNPGKNPIKMLAKIKSERDYAVGYINKPTEKRSRAFSELLNNRFPSMDPALEIYDPGDWNAFINQFLKEGGKFST